MVEIGHRVALRRSNKGGKTSAQQVSVLLSTMERIADLEEGLFKEEEMFEEVLLAKGVSMVMEPEYEHIVRMEALADNSKRAAEEGIPLELP